MNRQFKEENVAELKETLNNVASLIVTDYRGLTVEQVNNLRSEIRKAECTYRVVKNTMVKLAIKDTEMESMTPMFKGPTSIAYSINDPVAPAKIINKFAKDLKHLDIKGGYLDGQALDESGVKQLAAMKSKDELRSEFLMLLQAPAQNFVRLLIAAPQNFAYLLNARKDSL